MSLVKHGVAAIAGFVFGLAGANSSATTVVVSLDRETGERVEAARPAIDGSGLLVVFESRSPALVPDDTNGDVVDDVSGSDIFVRDRRFCTTTRVSVDSTGRERISDSIVASISGDGKVVSFLSNAALVPEDRNGVRDVYVRDLLTLTVERVSVSSSGDEAVSFAAQSLQGAPLSSDGRLVGFTSFAGNLATPPIACNGRCEVSHAFLRNRTTGVTTLLSVDESGVPATSSTRLVALSPTGDVAAMITTAPLVAADANGLEDLYLLDIASGARRRANLTQNGERLSPSDASLSEDGCKVVFGYRIVKPGSVSSGIAVNDCAKGYAELVETDAFGPAISADGRFLAYAGRRTGATDGHVPVRLDLASLSRVEFPALAGLPSGAFGISAHGEAVVSAQFGTESGAFAHGFLPQVPAACESAVVCEDIQGALDMSACALAGVASLGECRVETDVPRVFLLLAKAKEWLRSAAAGSGGTSSRHYVRRSIGCLDQAARRVRQEVRKDRLEPQCATELERVRSTERGRLRDYLGHLGP